MSLSFLLALILGAIWTASIRMCFVDGLVSLWGLVFFVSSLAVLPAFITYGKELIKWNNRPKSLRQRERDKGYIKATVALLSSIVNLFIIFGGLIVMGFLGYSAGLTMMAVGGILFIVPVVFIFL